MKKIVLILLMASGMLSACIKDFITPIGSKKDKIVSFKIGGLNHTVGETNVGFQTEPIKNFISQLTIIAYNSATGVEVKRATQLGTDANFGEISFDLPSASYNFVAIGSQTAFGINQFFEGNKNNPVVLPYADASFEYWQSSSSFQDRRYKTSDTFFAKQIAVVVSGDLQVDMIMQRIVGGLNVIITDASTYTIDMQNEFAAYKISTAQAFGTIENDASSGFKNSINGPIKYYILKTDGPTVRLVIKIYESGVFKGEKTINVNVYKNKCTTVTGNFTKGEYISTVE